MSARGERDGAAPAGYDLLVSDLDGTLLDDEMRLDPALVEAFHRAAERGLAISLATGRMPAVRRYCEEEGLTVDVIPDVAEFLGLGAFIKSLLIGHPRDLDVVREELTPIVAEHGRLVRTRHDYLEIIPVAASKGAGLARLAQHVGVPLARVVAVGDQENDIEMLREAGLGVAMPHAPEVVRRAADRVAPAAADGGLLRLLGELVPRHFA